MKIDKGIEYEFDYYKIKLSFDSGKTNVEKQIKLVLFVPNDYKFWDPDGAKLLKLPISMDDKFNSFAALKNNYRIVRFYDNIKLSGKHRWSLKGQKETSIKVKDCPDMIDCSLNTHEHPQKRNWMLFEHCGLTDADYVKVDWVNWTKCEIMIEYRDVTLYYRILVECTLHEVKKRGMEFKNYEMWKKLIDAQYANNNYHKMPYELLQEYHDSYLRDIIRLW